MTKQECIPVGCVPSATVAICWGGTWSRGMYLPGGGTWSWGCTWSQGVYLVLGGVPGPRGYLPGGCTCPGGGVPGPRVVYLVLGGVPGPRGVPAWGVYLPRYTPPRGQTDRCKNITFATSLRTIIILLSDLNV